MNQKKQSLLWKVWMPGGENRSSYLLGTMHVKSAVAFRQIDLIKYLIASCDAFAAELPIDEVNLHPEFARVFLANSSNQLKSNLSASKYQKIRSQILRAVNIDIEPLQHIRPMIISNMIDEAMMPPGTAQHALDETLWRYAKDLDKPTFGIETVENQINVLQQVEPKQELSAFLGSIKNISRHRTHIKKILHWYETQQIQLLYRSSYKNLGAWRQPLLKKRNQVMVDRLVWTIQAQSVFAAVGAAHLAGKYGVLRGLKAQGFRVAPIHK